MTSSLLLISGAGLPGWIWDEVTADLDAVVAPKPDDAGASLLDHARLALQAAPEGPIVVVAHSAGGMVASGITALAPERVRGILALSAVVPPAGSSFIGSMPMPQRLVLGTLMRLAGTRPPSSAIRKNLAAGLDEATAARIDDAFVPESQAYYRDKVTLQPPPHRGYISTSHDREFPTSLQRTFSDRLEPTYTATLETGHLPMLQEPAATREAISAFHQGVEAPRPSAP